MPLASTNINSLPTKQPGVQGPCARSKHDQTYSKHRPQEVRDQRVPRSEDNPNFNDRFQSSGSRSPQTGDQQNSITHGDELRCIAPRMGHTSKFEAASDHQGKGCGYAQDQKSNTWPAARKHRKQSLQIFPLRNRNFTLLRSQSNGRAHTANPQTWGTL